MRKYLRFLPLLATILAALLSPASSAPVDASDPYHVGVIRISAADAAAPVEALIWYPTRTPERPTRFGPFDVSASAGGDVAEGRFPIVLMSHGRRGSPLNHRELAASLARSGFIVVAPTHLGDAAGHAFAANQRDVLTHRPLQAIAALDALLKDQRFSAHADADHVGMIGYSAGGYTALVLAGARPDYAVAEAYCRSAGRDDEGSCLTARSREAPPTVPEQPDPRQPPSEPRLKALVLLDPLSMMFDAAGLAAVRLPILLYRPADDSYLKSVGNAAALAANLAVAPEVRTVPGRHFVFVDPCPEAVAAEVPALCVDDPAVDRVGLHRQMESEIATFLRLHL